MSIDETPTLAERYSRAVNTKRISVEYHRKTDADLLGAAGMTAVMPCDEAGQAMPEDMRYRRNHLGILLWRLAAEYDCVRASACKEQRLTKTEAIWIMAQLKTLRETKAALERYAVTMATRWRFMEPDSEVKRASAAVMDLMLAPACYSCGGTGATGELGMPRLVCRACNGSMERSMESLVHQPATTAFANRLRADVAFLCASARARMKRKLGERVWDEGE